MALVGDIIMDVRRRIPDPPNVRGSTLVSLAPTTGGSLTPTTYYVIGTQTNPWGETAVSPEVSITLSPGQNAIVVTFGVTAAGFTHRAYVATVSGGEAIFFSGPGQITITSLLTAAASPPPTQSTAFLPDSDGNFIGAFTAFQLLNRALSEMVRIAGGIIDVTGVQTTVNTSMYRLDAPFYAFTNAWFDGYPMDVVKRDQIYLRNSAAGFSGILSYEQDGTQSVIQVWPQSNRTGGQTTLANTMAVGDTTANLTSTVGFLAIGLCRIDNEVMAYSNQSPAGLGGMLRGLGGTAPAAHAAGATVAELNLRMSGRRMAPTYSPGDSLLTLNVPQAWETPLALHMLAQVRSMEQDDAASKGLLGDFVQMTDKITKASRLGQIKPRQITPWGQNVSDARNVNGVGFGWLIG